MKEVEGVHGLRTSKPLSQLRQALGGVMVTCWCMEGRLKQDSEGRLEEETSA